MYPQTVIEHYQTIFGEEPTIIVRAPGRINLIGEHTDYNGGYVLPAAIDKAIWFAAGPRQDNRLSFFALDLADNLEVDLHQIRQQAHKTWANYLLGVVSELHKDGINIRGLNLVFGGDVPLGAGLSSSAAVESGMGHLLNQMLQIGLDQMDIVKLAQRAENNFVGMQCGIMDMFASVMGKKKHVVRLDCRSLEYEYFPFETNEYTIVLCNSGVKHALVDSEYNVRRQEAEQGVAIMATELPGITTLRDVSPEQFEQQAHRLPEVVYRRCKYVIQEIRRVEVACEALKNGDLATFGQLMYQTHEGLQHDYEVSCPELDFLVDCTKEFNRVTTMPQAVLGSRMMGGGFGGCSVNLVRKTALSSFLTYMKTAFEANWNRELVCHEVSLTDGVSTVKITEPIFQEK